jgi:UDP-3-O-[3-hydroxymyristoyl] glucosamine N-acyltransferase
VIEAGVVIGAKAVIGDGCWIEANAVIGRGVTIGATSRIGANATISHAEIGSGTRLYPGVRVGQDGFGFAIDPAGHVKVPQLGRVIIGDHVEIGANSCIDRGAGPDTVIGHGTWIDNLVQIGHNVKIGRGCVLVAQSGVAGSTTLEDYAVLAALAGVAGHLKIGMGARIGAKSGVMKDVPAGEEQLGAPAMPVKEFMRQVIALKRLTKGQKSE